MDQKKGNKKKSDTPLLTPHHFFPRPDGKILYTFDASDPKAREAAAEMIANDAMEAADARQAAGGPVFNPNMPDYFRKQLERAAREHGLIVPGFSNVRGHEEEYRVMQEALKKRDEEKKKKEIKEGPPTTKFINSRLRECPRAEKFGENYENGILFGNYKGIGDLVPNLALFPKEFQAENRAKFYILDDSDRDKRPPADRVNPAYMCLTYRMKHFPDKKLYLRTLSPVCNGITDRRVVSEEVYEMLQLVLVQQGCPLADEDLRLFLLRGIVEPIPYRKYYIYRTMGMKELLAILEFYDVNKSLITLVDDITYEQGQRDMLKFGETENHFVNYSGDKSMLISQAIRHVFHSVVYGVHWERDECKKHENCLEQFKKMILFVMREYAEFDENHMIEKDVVEKHINNLKSHCSFVLQEKLNLRQHIVELKNFDHHGRLRQSELKKWFSAFGLSDGFLTNDSVVIYKARLLLTLGFIKKFFTTPEKKIQSILINSMMHKVTMFEWEAMNKFMLKEMGMSAYNGQNDSEKTDDVMEALEKMNISGDSKNQGNKENEATKK